MCLNSKERESLKARETEARVVRADSTAYGFQISKRNMNLGTGVHAKPGNGNGPPCIKPGFWRADNISKKQSQDEKFYTPWEAVRKRIACWVLGARSSGPSMCRVQMTASLQTEDPGPLWSRLESALKGVFITRTHQTHPEGKPTKMSSQPEITNYPGIGFTRILKTTRELGKIEWAEHDYKTAGLTGRKRHNVCPSGNAMGRVLDSFSVCFHWPWARKRLGDKDSLWSQP